MRSSWKRERTGMKKGRKEERNNYSYAIWIRGTHSIPEKERKEKSRRRKRRKRISDEAPELIKGD